MVPSSTNTVSASFLTGGGEIGELIRSYDWSTTSLGALQNWPLSLRTLVQMMITSRFPMLIFWGPELITFYNDAFRPSLGNNGKHPSSLGQRGEESWAESWPVIGPMIYGIMAGDEAVWFEDQKLPLYREGKMGYAYWTYSFSPLTDDAGAVNGVLVTCSETTKSVESREQLALSEERFSRLIGQAPVAVALFSGPQFVISLANERVLEYWGRTREQVMDKPLFEALPEAAGQGFEELLTGVYTTGERFVANELTVTLERNGRLEPTYIDFVYEPFHESDGQISGVMVICTEITEQILARRQVEASETRLRSVITNAPAAMGLYVGRDMVVELPNQSFVDIVGKGPHIEGKPLREVMPELESENQPFLQLLDDVYTSGQMFQSFGSQVKILRDGVMTENYYNITYTPLRDEQGEVFAILDIAIDVTQQIKAQQDLQQSETRYRQLSADLEQQVQARIQELQALIGDLRRSNENLQQFAYIASHDLQEPLRKIQSFGDLLKVKYGHQLGEGIGFLERMQASASRMSTLIKDLLSFSRISNQQETTEQVSLGAVVEAVLNDLEIVIQETGAEVIVEPLPTVEGDPSQLSQLFQNLITNALKFRRSGVAPSIAVRCVQVASDALPSQVQPARQAPAYYCITVADNGIGFDERYAERIFQVFQRLHGKSEYVGTGIGLAICQKVAANHGGTITATSQPGQGATFSVYLPA